MISRPIQTNFYIQCSFFSKSEHLEQVEKQHKTTTVVTPRVRLALLSLKAAEADAADTSQTM